MKEDYEYDFANQPANHSSHYGAGNQREIFPEGGPQFQGNVVGPAGSQTTQLQPSQSNTATQSQQMV